MSSANSRHPEAPDILRLLDGELLEAEARTLNRHLESCWHCRRERNEMEAAIDVFVRYRERALLPGLPPPPRSWPDMAQRCAEFDAVRAPAPRIWPVWRFAAAGLLALAVIAATITLRPKPQAAPPAAPEPVEKQARPPGPPAVKTELPKLPAQPLKPPRSPLEVEVAVWQALHAEGADLGEPIEVLTSSDGVLVKATALDVGRMDVIRRAVAAIPGARFEEVALPPAAASTGGNDTVIAPRPILFASRIRAELGSDAALQEFANSALDMGEAIMARAHARNRLEQRFAGRALTAEDAETVRTIDADHRQAIRRQALELRKLLAKVFPETEGEPAVHPPAANAGRAFDEAINAAFAGAQSGKPDAELLAELQRLVREFSQ